MFRGEPQFSEAPQESLIIIVYLFGAPAAFLVAYLHIVSVQDCEPCDREHVVLVYLPKRKKRES